MEPEEFNRYSEKQFWDDAHIYTRTTGEEQFVSEIAYIMTALHEEGTCN
jgi:hypothetical protein